MASSLAIPRTHMNDRRFDAPTSDDGLALKKRLDALSRLIELTGRLAAEHDLDAVLVSATELACWAIGCDRASLFVFDEASQSLVMRVATELEVHELRLPLGQGIAGWVAERRELVNVPDPSADLRWSDVADRVTGFTTRNLLAAAVAAAARRQARRRIATSEQG